MYERELTLRRDVTDRAEQANARGLTGLIASAVMSQLASALHGEGSSGETKPSVFHIFSSSVGCIVVVTTTIQQPAVFYTICRVALLWLHFVGFISVASVVLFVTSLVTTESPLHPGPKQLGCSYESL